jgi:hypothetical protein
MQNTVAKKRAGQKDVDSDWLFDNCLQRSKMDAASIVASTSAVTRTASRISAPPCTARWPINLLRMAHHHGRLFPQQTPQTLGSFDRGRNFIQAAGFDVFSMATGADDQFTIGLVGRDGSSFASQIGSGGSSESGSTGSSKSEHFWLPEPALCTTTFIGKMEPFPRCWCEIASKHHPQYDGIVTFD